MLEIKDISFNWKDHLFDLYISQDCYDFKKQFPDPESEYFAQNLLANVINQLFSKKHSDDVDYDRLDELLTQRGLSRVAVLNAHGETMNGIWHYSDDITDSAYDIKWEYVFDEKKTAEGTTSTVSRFKRTGDSLILPVEGGIAEFRTIDSWISQQEDKRYGALILVCCNEDIHIPLVQSTPIIYAKGNIGLTADYQTVLLEPEN